MNNFFCPCTIMVLSVPAKLNGESMVGEGNLDGAIAKIDEFFHQRYQLPVNWIVCARSLELYAGKFREWKKRYGDEIGIYEPGIYGKETTTIGLQSWLEELGIERPSVPGWPGFVSWGEMSEDQQVKIIGGLKQRYDKVLEQDTKVMYAANGDAATVRSMKKCGIEVMWGYNWNLYGDLVDTTGKGALPYPFYVSSDHAKAPAEPGDCRLLGVPWGTADLLNAYCTSRQSKISLNNVCLNAHELANRSGGVPAAAFVERVFAQAASQAEWNPLAYIPLQIEANWIDESGVFYGQHPDYPSQTTEIFFHEVETALRHGARIVSFSHFLQWYREHFDRTPEQVMWQEDLLAGTDFRGKDQDFAPMVLYGDHERQMIFLKANGFNPTRSYHYIPGQTASDASLEYPYGLEPDVELKVKGWTTPCFGIEVTPEDAVYRAAELELTAARAYPDYACTLWSSNIPEYIEPESLQCSDNIKRIRLIRAKNLAIVFADLKPGNNTLKIESSEPGRFIHMEAPRRSGRRYEIYLHNSGATAAISSLKFKLDKNLQIGGFWWDGQYYPTINYYHHSWYDWRSGDLHLRTAYPNTLTLRPGQTRLSIEILGNFTPDVK